MDKITRVLTLYHSLMKGNVVNKYSYAVEFGVSARSLDRDIQDIRLFLSDSFSGMELIYDEKLNGYHIKGLPIQRDAFEDRIDIGACYVLTKLLLACQPLRTDDQSEIVRIMLSQLSKKDKQQITPVLQHAPQSPTRLIGKASVKLVADLLYSIDQMDEVLLRLGPDLTDILCVPYSIEFCSHAAYLVAWVRGGEAAALFPLDDIQSYTRKGTYPLRESENIKVQHLVELVCHQDSDAYQASIYKKGD